MNLLLNCLAYIQAFLKIRTKEGSVIPLVLNKPQRRLYEAIRRQWNEGKPVRIIILKARQMGFSTLTEAIIFWMTATACFVESMIVAHKEEATANLFRMSKRFYDFLPPKLKPMLRSSNAQELVFDRPARLKGNGKGLGSRIRCATAGGSGIGRSYTLKALHLSEFAFWPGDKRETLTGLLQAVPDLPGTLIVIESTANGFDEFKKMWDDAVEAQKNGTDGFYPIFFAWHEMEEYRRTPRPGFQRTPEEEALAETYGLDDEQLAWRRWCIAEQCGGDINLFRQEYPASPDEAFIATGQCVFDKEALVLRREQVKAVPWEYGSFRIRYDEGGRIESWEWEPDPKGAVRIRTHPQKGVPYVLAGDTAGTGSDKFAGQLLDNRNGEQVAVIHHRFGERYFAEQCYCLGFYYNTALIGIETNYSTFPERILEELRYPRLYVRQHEDSYTRKLQETYGFETNVKTRKLIVDNLKDVSRQALDTIYDYDTLGEMLTFVYDEKWKPQAERGEHDDLVMALAIAHHIRCQQTSVVDAGTAAGSAEWTEDMWQDYYNATPGQQTMLLQMWGRPKEGRL